MDKKKPLIYSGLVDIQQLISDPAGTRTQDPYIKSVLLYQLSYGIFAPYYNYLVEASVAGFTEPPFFQTRVQK